MFNNPIDLAKKFISIKSIVGNEKELRSILALAERQLTGSTVEKFESGGSHSLLAYAGHHRPEHFHVILNGHLDVTPGTERQYKPFVKDDRLYGVGAMDMKSSVASLIQVFKELAPKLSYPLGLQLTTDEQQGGFNGTSFQVRQGVRSDFVIAGESTNLNIAHKAKGVLWVKASVKGKQSHSAYPWLAKNPIYNATSFVEAIRQAFPTQIKETQQTTVAVSNIKTNSNTYNKTPSMTEVWLDVRYAAEDSEGIVNTIKSLLPSGDWKFEVLVNEPALHTKASSKFIEKLYAATKETLGREPVLYGAQGTSDARHYASMGADCVEFGPAGDGIGSENEWVSIQSLNQYQDILRKFLTSL